MSRFGKPLMAALLLTALCAFAQDSNQSAPAPSTPSVSPNPRRGDRAQQRLKRLSKRLNLTDDQRAKLRPILQDEDQQMKAVEADSSLTQQQRHRKMRDIRIASRTQMDAILTDEQKQKLQSTREAAAARHGKRSGGATSGTSTPDQTTPQ